MRTTAAALAITMLGASTANAQEKLWVRSDTPARVLAPDGAIVGTCRGDCSYLVYPGRYTVEVDETPEAPGKTRNIDVRGPMTVDVESGSKSSRSTGLALAVVGTAAVPIGLIGVLANTHTCLWDCRYDHETSNRSAQTAWALVAAGGAAMAGAGWALWASSNTKIRARREAAVALVPTRDGAFGGLTVTF